MITIIDIPKSKDEKTQFPEVEKPFNDQGGTEPVPSLDLPCARMTPVVLFRGFSSILPIFLPEDYHKNGEPQRRGRTSGRVPQERKNKPVQVTKYKIYDAGEIIVHNVLRGFSPATDIILHDDIHGNLWQSENPLLVKIAFYRAGFSCCQM